jgi:hypothetical protein
LDGRGRGAGGSAVEPLLLGPWGSRSRSAASRRWPMSLARSASISPSYGVASAPMAWARRWDEDDTLGCAVRVADEDERRVRAAAT